MHKLLAKQLVRATDAAGTLDVAALSELVSAAYDETDRDRRRTERSIALMVEELDQLSSRDREQLHAQLELQSQRFEAAVENMTQGLCMFDGEHKLITCNKRWMELFSVSEHLGKPGTQYRDILAERVASGHFPGRTFDEVLAERLAIHRSRTPRVFEQRLRDGRIVITFHQPLDQGGWVSTFEDVTEVRTQNLRFEAAVENMTQGLCMFDAEQKLIICNKRWLDLFGIPRALGQPGTAFRAVLEARLANGHYAGRTVDDIIAERAAMRREAKPKTFEQHLGDGRVIQTYQQPFADGGWVSTFEDVTERRRAEAQIAHMSRHDALTDLPNRVLFREHMEQDLARVRRGEPLAVLCLDLDDFKGINDTLGHAAGDAVLKAVAGRLRDCVRDTDTVARLGGDEFAVLQVGGRQPTHATALAQRIVEAVAQPFDFAGHQLMIGVSVGIAVSPSDGDSPDQLMKNADLALYRVKQDGRNGFRFFEPEMDARMKLRRSLELDLRKALAHGEFELFYQPVVNLARDEIRGFEALLRWRHPERGLIPPLDFIPLAEETGLIIPIGEWVVRNACAEAATWGGDVTVAVNLSAIQFRSKNLVPTIVSALATSRLPATHLEVEITESVLMQDNDATLAVLHQLRELGVRISMDDFGTGYSSLSYLRQFPFDKIKIDRSFVRDLAERSDSLSIVRAVTGLGSSLGMTTTAEGVETPEQLSMLRAEGCTEVQGYIFSPPRPAHEVARLLKQFGAKSRHAASA